MKRSRQSIRRIAPVNITRFQRGSLHQRPRATPASRRGWLSPCLLLLILYAGSRTSVAGAADLSQTLNPGSSVDVVLGPDQVSVYELTLPDGSATDLQLTQQSGFVDLELRCAPDAAIEVRTEAGVAGHIDATLLGSGARPWRVMVSARKGKGAARVTLRLADARPAAPIDALRSSAFERYAEAELLRRTNYRETAVTQRSSEIDERTRSAYAAAQLQYAQAGDGCGARRADIGASRMENAIGNYALARALAESALAAACEGDIAEQAQALKTRGMAAAYQGDFAASAEAAEGALTLYVQTGDRRYQGIVLGNLSEVYMQLGSTERALAAADGALAAAVATADAQGIVFSRKSIAAIHLARGELANALQDYRSMLNDLHATPYPMIEGETWNDLGIVYHRMAAYPESLEAFASAQRVWETMHNRGGSADTSINQAQTLRELGQTRIAMQDFSRALDLSRADGLKSIEARALRGLGSTSLARGRLPAARTYFTQSLDVARAAGELAAQSYALRGMGEVNLRERRLGDALICDQAALTLARQAADRDGQAAALAQLARDAAASGDLDAANKHIAEAMASIEAQRSQIDDPSLRTSYFSSMRAYEDTEIAILMSLDARFPSKGYARAALAAAERARARSLQDMFAERSIDVSRELAPGLAHAQRIAEDRLSAAAFRLGRLSANAGADQRASLVSGVDSANRALDDVRGEIRRTNPRYADFMRPPGLNVDELQHTLLRPDTAAVEYWLGSRESYAWIISPTSFRVIRLAGRATLEPLAANLTALLRQPPHVPEGEGFDGLAAAEHRQRQTIDRAAANLAAVLFKGNLLGGLPRKLAIVADGALQSLPFSFLPMAEHDVSYLPSLMTVKWLRGRTVDPARPASLAVFASPLLESPVAASSGAGPEPRAPPPLPSSRIEAEAISAFLPSERVWLALGAEASRDRALSADWRRYTLVHFATHAVMDRRRPELSGIVLSTYDIHGHPQDGALRMNDIYNLDMPVDLVVLSGCETAAGRLMESEGALSLSRAFLYAGARRVVASLWPVEDRASAAFMREFYRNLLVEHMQPAAALRIAQQEIARDNRWAAPYYWSGFVLQGDWD